MTTKAELTIVIPAKNEIRYLPSLLESLTKQDYPLLPITKVYVADAGSSDGTADAARSFAYQLNIEVIPGGMPSVGRNAGARRATTPYVLFIDADMQLGDPTLLRRALRKMKAKRLHCLTTNIACSNGNLLDDMLYAANNFVQRISSFTKPFSSGMFMLFDKNRFDQLGGFHEGAFFAEDFLLSKQVSPTKFGIVGGHVLTSNRRFQKTGRLRMMWMFLNTTLNMFNESYFLKDRDYWTEPLKFPEAR